MRVWNTTSGIYAAMIGSEYWISFQSNHILLIIYNISDLKKSIRICTLLCEIPLFMPGLDRVDRNSHTAC